MACSTCARGDVAEINEALELGTESISALARRKGISKTSLLRHEAHALPRASGAPHGPDKPAGFHVEDAPAPTTAREPGNVAVTPTSDRAPTHSGRPGAGRPCSTCQSPHRAEIEKLLTQRVPARTIETQIGEGAPSHDSISRHAAKCIPRILTLAHAESDAAAAVSISGDLSSMRDDLISVWRLMLNAVSEVQRQIEDGTPCEACGRSGEEDHERLLRTVREFGALAPRIKDALHLTAKLTGELRERDRDPDLRDCKGWDRFVLSIGQAVRDCENCSDRVAAALEKLDES